MARRAEQLKKIKKVRGDLPLLHLDAGGLTKYDSGDLAIKLETILEAYRLMDVQAINVSERELYHLGADVIKLKDMTEIPLLSANIYDSKTGERIFAPYTVIKAGKYKIGVIGVCKQGRVMRSDSEGLKLEIKDPMEAAENCIKELKGKTDFNVLLAHVNYRSIYSMAKDLEGIDFILGGDGYTTTWSDIVIDDKVISYAGRQGQKLMLINADLSGENIEETRQQIISLKLNLPEDAQIKELVDVALGKLKKGQKKVNFALEALRGQVNKSYVSYTSCRSCHPEAYSKWRTTRHYVAMNPLISSKQINDHSCLPCHTTGYRDRGFVDIRVTPKMLHVQCEACHGAGADHLKNPQQNKMLTEDARNSCVICHDRDNSPSFEFEAYWEKIQH